MTMARKIYPYSLDRKDAKIAGVCSTLGANAGSTRPSSASPGLRSAADAISSARADRLCGGRHLPRDPEEASMTGDRRMSDFDRMDEVVEAQADGPRDAHRARRDRPPADGDRPPHQQPER